MEHHLEVRVNFGDCHSERQSKNEGDSKENDMTSIQSTSNTVPNSSEEEKKRETFLRDTIRERDVKVIARVITPLALTGCKTNALLMAMEVCYELRLLATNKRPDEKDLMMVANNVEDFAFCLLDPLESDSNYISKYEGFFAEVLDAAIEFHQKKLLIHPVLYNFTNYKWHGKFEAMKRRSISERQRWKWFFLNFWCIFDVILFPFIFTLCFLLDNVKERFLGPKDLVIKLLVMDGIPYSIGDQIAKFVHRKCCRRKVTWSWVDPLEPCLHRNRAWSSADKVLVVCSNQNHYIQENEEHIQHYKRCGFKIIPIPIRFGKGKDVESESRDIGIDQLGQKIGNSIISEMDREAMYGRYLEYFTTPYFVFVRDTLSYLALLGLHFAVCFVPPSVELSGLEWAMLILFTGRLAMKLETFNNCKIMKTEDHSGILSIIGARIKKYISDPSNVLDAASFLVYFPTIALRIFISLISQSVANNRALAISGYMYGFITILVVLRVLNQLLEKGKGVGAVQIAFFNIIQDVCAVLLQFAATIIAFSIGLTKVLIAEKYRANSGRDVKDHACKDGSSAILCWWMMVKHLAWSSVGITSLDRLPLVDDYPSMLLVYLLYGAFLISAVVLLLNMVIALLFSTYQRISDNSLSEWSFKKVTTLQTYNGLQPIPVPYNLAAFLVRFCLRCIRRRFWKGNGEETQKSTLENGDDMDMIVKELQQKYFEKYGSHFPRTAHYRHEINTIRTNCQIAKSDDYSGSRDEQTGSMAAMGNDDGGFAVTVQKIGVRSKLFSQMKDLKELKDTGLMPTSVFEQQKLVILKEITELSC